MRTAEYQEAVTERYAPAIDVPPPAVLTHARWNVESRLQLLTTYGAISPAELADLHGSAARNRGALADNWRRAGRVVTVSYRGRLLLPGFQFTSDGNPHPVIAEILALLRRMSGTDWSVALWFTTPNGFLPDWGTPADALTTRRDAPVSGDDPLGLALLAAASDAALPDAGLGGAETPVDRRVRRARR